MPTVRHPKALDEVTGNVPGRVTVDGENYAVDEDGTVALEDDHEVRKLANAHGVSPAALRSDDEDAADAGTCDVVKNDGDVCGRELPCPYHSDDDAED